MTKMEYEIISNKETLSQDKKKIIDKYLSKELRRKEKFNTALMEGASDEFKRRFVLFPIGKIPAPVRIPSWMFRHFPDDPDFELPDDEKVALAHVIHFTNPSQPWGYLECSGDIENWLRITPKEAHEILDRLIKKNMIFRRKAPESATLGHERDDCYLINIDYLHTVLMCYDTDIWN